MLFRGRKAMGPHPYFHLVGGSGWNCQVAEDIREFRTQGLRALGLFLGRRY